MDLPPWLETLRERYLADAGNVFLLYGPRAADGEIEPLLRSFLRRTRPIVGTLRPYPLPSRLEFAEIGDRARFENLIKAYDLLVGRVFPQDEAEPTHALARIWRALSTTGTDQAYLITEVERLAPAHRKSRPPIPDAPDLIEWALADALRRSNNLVLLLAPSLDAVRVELAERCVAIEVTDAAAPPAPAPSAPTTIGNGDPAPTRAQLVEALRSALAADPAPGTVVPVLRAVAEVAARHRPTFAGADLAVDADGAPIAINPAGERFLAAWRGDIALDAAASMLVRTLRAQPEGGIDETAVAALARRVQRLIDRTP